MGTFFQVCDVEIESLTGVASRSTRIFDHTAALAALRSRIMDDYSDWVGDVYGVDDETGNPNYPVPARADFLSAIVAVNACRGNGGCPDVVFGGTRYWLHVDEEAD